MVGACLGQVWLDGVPLGLLWVQVQRVAPAGARQAVLIGWLPPEPAIQRALPLPARPAHIAWRTGLHVQLPHCMPDLHVQLLHGAEKCSCTAPQAPPSPSSALHKDQGDPITPAAQFWLAYSALVVMSHPRCSACMQCCHEEVSQAQA